MQLSNFYWVENYGFDNLVTKAKEILTTHLQFGFIFNFVLYKEGNMHPDLRNGWI